MNRYIRILFSTATLALMLLYGLSSKVSMLTWGGLTIILLIYLVMIWVHPNWWTRNRYILLTASVTVLVLLLSLEGGKTAYLWYLLLPLALLLAKEQQKYWRLAALLTIATLASIIMVLPDYTNALEVLPEVLALYFCIRGINIYKESYRLSQLHVQKQDEANRELQQMHGALQEATVHSMRYAALAERTRLARDMHDGIGHQLTSLIVQLQALEIMLPGDPQQAARVVPTMLEIARKSMAEVRQSVRAWQEDESGLGLVALQGLVTQCAEHSQLTLKFQHQEDVSEWPVELSVALYRVLQEALTNIMRYAQATTVNVQLQEDEQQIILVIADDGCYTENISLTPGTGIKGMRERCQALGGSCSMQQLQPHGLKIQIQLPLIPELETSSDPKSQLTTNRQTPRSTTLPHWSPLHA